MGVLTAGDLQPAEGLEVYPGSSRKPSEVLRPRSGESGDLGFASLESGRAEEKRVGGEETEGLLRPPADGLHLCRRWRPALGRGEKQPLCGGPPFLSLLCLLLDLSVYRCLLCLCYSVAWLLYFFHTYDHCFHSTARLGFFFSFC